MAGYYDYYIPSKFTWGLFSGYTLSNTENTSKSSLTNKEITDAMTAYMKKLNDYTQRAVTVGGKKELMLIDEFLRLSPENQLLYAEEFGFKNAFSFYERTGSIEYGRRIFVEKVMTKDANISDILYDALHFNPKAQIDEDSLSVVVKFVEPETTITKEKGVIASKTDKPLYNCYIYSKLIYNNSTDTFKNANIYNLGNSSETNTDTIEEKKNQYIEETKGDPYFINGQHVAIWIDEYLRLSIGDKIVKLSEVPEFKQYCIDEFGAYETVFLEEAASNVNGEIFRGSKGFKMFLKSIGADMEGIQPTAEVEEAYEENLQTVIAETTSNSSPITADTYEAEDEEDGDPFWVNDEKYDNLGDFLLRRFDNMGTKDDIVDKLYSSSYATYNAVTTHNGKKDLVSRRPYEADKFSHRLGVKDTFIRIGDCQFNIPPTAIQEVIASNVQRQTGLRQNGSTKSQSGYAKEMLKISLWFNNIEDINGYEVESPFNDEIFHGIYYMDGLRALIAQFNKLPFVPIVNEYINGKLGIFNVALINLSFKTVPDFPYSIEAELTLKNFNVEPYLECGSVVYNDSIDWDLFRWYYQRQMFYGSNSMKHLKYMYDTIGAYDIKFKILETNMIGMMETLGINIAQCYTSKFRTVDMWSPNIEDYIDLDDLEFSVDRIQISLSNILPEIQMSNHESPTMQYMGQGDSIINIDITTTDEDSIYIFKHMKQYCDSITRAYKDKNVIGFIRLDNAMTELAGIQYVLLDTVAMGTVPGFPGVTSISLSFVGFDQTQKQKEDLFGFLPFDGSAHLSSTRTQVNNQVNEDGITIRDAQDYFAMEKLEGINLYPDLELPTYNQINQVLTSINSYRSAHGIRGGIKSFVPESPYSFVDPDFYVMQRDFTLTDSRYKDLISDDDWAMIDTVFQFQPEETTIIGALGKITGSGIKKTVVNTDADSNPVEVNNYLLHYDKLCPKFLGAVITQRHPMERSKKSGQYDITMMQDFIPERMCHDMIQYGKKGRMLKAYPTYLLVFIDEGSGWLKNQKLWSNYYVTHSAISIEVQKSKSTPNGTARIVMNNQFNNISDDDWDKQLNYEYEDRIDFGAPDLRDEAISNHTQILKTINLVAGVRLQIKMGYGNTIKKLPTTFNGVITNVSHGMTSQIIAQSDGIELINSQMNASTEDAMTSMNNYGRESSNIIKSIMTQRRKDSVPSNFVNEWKSLSQFEINHFGIHVQNEFTFFNLGSNLMNGTIMEKIDNEEVMNNWNTYDITRNIYIGNTDRIGTYNSQSMYDPEKWAKFVEAFQELSEKESSLTSNSKKEELIDDLFDEAEAAIYKRIWLGRDGEKNYKVLLYGRTPWDIFQVITATEAGFICSPLEFNFRSTLFFGLPMWNVKYESTMGLKDGPFSTLSNGKELYSNAQFNHNSYFYNFKPTGANYNNIDVGTRNALRTYEKSKPFAQFHMITGLSNIIDNQLEASADGVYATNCRAYRTVANESRANSIIYADKNIDETFQKTKVVDTSIAKNTWIPNFAEKPLESMVSFFGTSSTEKRARHAGISFLQNSFETMYQGDIITLGAAEMKPHDIVYISDDYADITGLVSVRQTVHSISQDGYVSSFTPSLISFSVESDYIDYPSYLKLQTMGSLFSAIEGIKSTATFIDLLDELMEEVLDKQSLEKKVVGAQSTLVPLELASLLVIIRRSYQGIKAIGWMGAFGKLITKATLPIKALTLIKSAGGIRAAWTAAKAAAGVVEVATAPTIIGPVIIEALIWAIQGCLNTYLKYEQNKNVLKILPVMHKGKFYVAGIDGQQLLIPGFEDGDSLLLDKINELSKNLEIPKLQEYDAVIQQIVKDSIEHMERIEAYLEAFRQGVYNQEFEIVKNNLDVYGGIYPDLSSKSPTLYRRNTEGKDTTIKVGCYAAMDNKKYSKRYRSEDGAKNLGFPFIEHKTNIGDTVHAIADGLVVRIGLGLNEGGFTSPESIMENINMLSDIQAFDKEGVFGSGDILEDLKNYFSEKFFNENAREVVGWNEDDQMFCKHSVIICHFDNTTGEKYFSTYLNLLTIETTVMDWVTAGQVIGTAGVLIPDKFLNMSVSEGANLAVDIGGAMIQHGALEAVTGIESGIDSIFGIFGADFEMTNIKDSLFGGMINSVGDALEDLSPIIAREGDRGHFILIFTKEFQYYDAYDTMTRPVQPIIFKTQAQYEEELEQMGTTLEDLRVLWNDKAMISIEDLSVNGLKRSSYLRALANLLIQENKDVYIPTSYSISQEDITVNAFESFGTSMSSNTFYFSYKDSEIPTTYTVGKLQGGSNSYSLVVTSRYGVLRDGVPHGGIDLAPSPAAHKFIHSLTEGLVISTTPEYLYKDKGFGVKVVVVTKIKGVVYTITYAHLQKCFVTAGQKISIGTLIGTFGNSGNCWSGGIHITEAQKRAGEDLKGLHLHLQVDNANGHVNPYSVFGGDYY